MGSSHPNIAPYGSFPASDGSIIIAVLSERFWGRLCEALERPELATDPRFLTPTLRRDHRDELDRLISEVTETRTVAEWETRLAAADVPHAPVLGVTAALSHPHAVAREMVVEADHPAIGPMNVVGRPIKFPGAPQRPVTAPPTMSPSGMPSLTGMWPRSPLMLSAPDKACVTMSKEGLSRKGPVRPKPLIAQ